jgi:hypothetical protein
LIHSMRLSLMKGAHADLSITAWQEIGVKPSVGLSGIMALDVPPPLLPGPLKGNKKIRRRLPASPTRARLGLAPAHSVQQVFPQLVKHQ